MQISVYQTGDNCYFLVSEQESNQRSRPGRGITSKSHPRPGPHSRRNDHRPLKMSRFSAGYAVQLCWFAIWKRSKIGTFLNAGRRCGWGLQRGRDLHVAPLCSAAFGTSTTRQEPPPCGGCSHAWRLRALILPNQEKGVYPICATNRNLNNHERNKHDGYEFFGYD